MMSSLSRVCAGGRTLTFLLLCLFALQCRIWVLLASDLACIERKACCKERDISKKSGKCTGATFAECLGIKEFKVDTALDAVCYWACDEVDFFNKDLFTKVSWYGLSVPLYSEKGKSKPLPPDKRLAKEKTKWARRAKLDYADESKDAYKKALNYTDDEYLKKVTLITIGACGVEYELTPNPNIITDKTTRRRRRRRLANILTANIAVDPYQATGVLGFQSFYPADGEAPAGRSADDGTGAVINNYAYHGVNYVALLTAGHNCYDNDAPHPVGGFDQRPSTNIKFFLALNQLADPQSAAAPPLPDAPAATLLGQQVSRLYAPKYQEHDRFNHDWCVMVWRALGAPPVALPQLHVSFDQRPQPVPVPWIPLTWAMTQATYDFHINDYHQRTLTFPFVDCGANVCWQNSETEKTGMSGSPVLKTADLGAIYGVLVGENNNAAIGTVGHKEYICKLTKAKYSEIRGVARIAGSSAGNNQVSTAHLANYDDYYYGYDGEEDEEEQQQSASVDFAANLYEFFFRPSPSSSSTNTPKQVNYKANEVYFVLFAVLMVQIVLVMCGYALCCGCFGAWTGFFAARHIVPAERYNHKYHGVARKDDQEDEEERV